MNDRYVVRQIDGELYWNAEFVEWGLLCFATVYYAYEAYHPPVGGRWEKICKKFTK